MHSIDNIAPKKRNIGREEPALKKGREMESGANEGDGGGEERLMVSYYLHEKKRITVFYGKMEGCGQGGSQGPSKNLLE